MQRHTPDEQPGGRPAQLLVVVRRRAVEAHEEPLVHVVRDEHGEPAEEIQDGHAGAIRHGHERDVQELLYWGGGGGMIVSEAAEAGRKAQQQQQQQQQ